MTLDHLVYAVPDLARAIDAFQAALGVRPHAGGRHEGIGTHNAILPLDSRCYVELIAIDPAAQKSTQGRPFGLDRLERPTLATWALSASEIEAAAEAARGRGYDPGAIIALSREQPGGGTLSWRLSIAPPVAGGLVPFLIDWGDSPHPAAQGTGECSLVSFRAEHPEPPVVRELLAALGASLEVDAGPSARLIAEIRGPAGSLVLD